MCSFAHGREALQPQPDLYRTQVCFQYMQIRMCKYGDRCTFAHGEGQLRGQVATAGPNGASATVQNAQHNKELNSEDMPQEETFFSDPLFQKASMFWPIIPWSGSAAAATPASSTSLSGILDVGSCEGSEFGDYGWSTSSPTTELSEDGLDDEVEVEVEFVVEKTFLTLKGTASSSSPVRRRATSVPASGRR